MKKININIAIIITGLLFLPGCEDYLEVPPDTITESEVFTSYTTFQGYIDNLYPMLVDYNNHAICVSANFGGSTTGSKPWNSAYAGTNGEYWWIVNNSGISEERNIYRGYGNDDDQFARTGLYDYWGMGNRICNNALANIPNLVNATEEQKSIIEGQALFFRAFLHWEIVRAFGSIPYVDELITGENVYDPRYWTDEETGKQNTQAVFEKISRDLEAAAELLPAEYPANQLGRITKGACYALQAKALLYAGSPLFNEESGNEAVFDKEYMRRAANAAGKVISLNTYTLPALQPGVDLDPYLRIFTTKERSQYPYSSETILQRIEDRGWGRGQYMGSARRLFVANDNRFGGNAVMETPTQNYVDKYEVLPGNGTAIRYQLPPRAINGDYDNSAWSFDKTDSLWNHRDPRFRKTIWVHGDVAGTGINEFTINLETDGAQRANGNNTGCYIIHKWLPLGVERHSADYGDYTFVTPLLRMSEVYLIYAEAIFEQSGDYKKSSETSQMTAEQAVNMVRARAGMPTVENTIAAYNTTISEFGETSSDAPFRKLVRNERCVELAFEGHYWFDTRRWKITKKIVDYDKRLYTLEFDANVERSTLYRNVVQDYIFTNKHYWLPFPVEQVELNPDGFPQNSGW